MKKNILTFVLVILSALGSMYVSYRVHQGGWQLFPVNTSPLVSVSELSRNPMYYSDQKVKLVGVVRISLSLGLKAYILEDHTGRVLVRPKKGSKTVPLQGSYIQVEGTLHQPVVVGGIQVLSIQEI